MTRRRGRRGGRGRRGRGGGGGAPGAQPAQAPASSEGAPVAEPIAAPAFSLTQDPPAPVAEPVPRADPGRRRRRRGGSGRGHGGPALAADAPALPAAPIPDSELDRMRACEDVLNYRFWDRGFLREALTHSSAKDARHPSNERMEFLGDAVLGLVVCEHLYRTQPRSDEGILTEVKSAVVSRAALAKRGKEMGLERWLFVGKGTGRGGKLPPSLTANLFEALIAAVYLDGGFEIARRFILRHLEGEIQAVSQHREGVNYKSLLQQWAQSTLGVTPAYAVISETGPEHRKEFRSRVRLGDRDGETGSGRNKKEAEQDAARLTLAAQGVPAGADSTGA